MMIFLEMLEVVVFVLVEDAVLPLLLLYLGHVGTDEQENIGQFSRIYTINVRGFLVALFILFTKTISLIR